MSKDYTKDENFIKTLSNIVNGDADKIQDVLSKMSVNSLMELIDSVIVNDPKSARELYLDATNNLKTESINVMRSKKPITQNNSHKKTSKRSMNESILGMSSMPNLDRLRKLSGMRESDYETDLDGDVGNDFDSDTIDATPIPMSDNKPSLPPVDDYENTDFDDMFPVEEPSAFVDTSNVISDVEQLMDQLEQKITSIPVGDYKAVVSRLRDILNTAVNVGRDNLVENRKSLKDAMHENDDSMSIGKTRTDAVKSLQTRMGDKPGDRQKAEKAFDKLRKDGGISMKNGEFSMKTMGDDEFDAETYINDK